MERNSGNALLVVTLLSIVMVLAAMGLVTFTSGQHQASYGLNNQVCLRYAAEGAIEEVKLRLFRDKNESPAGVWFLPTFRAGLSSSDLAAYTAAPTSGPYAAAQPGFTRVLGGVGAGLREVQVDVYFDKTANANEFVARAKAFVKAEGPSKFSAHMKMVFAYTCTTTTPPGLAAFSKYSLFMDRWDPNLWFGHESYDGYVHSNQSVQFLFKDARFYKELTYVGSENYYWGWTWTQAEKDAMFPGGKTKLAAPIPMPSFQDIRNDVRPIAQAGPPELFIDPAAALPNPWSGAILDSVKVTFVWDGAAGQNYAYLQGFNAGSLQKTVKYAVPKSGADTLIYATKPVHVKGIVQGRVTVASEATGNQAVRITDDIVYVDDQGRPKTWVFTSGGSPLPASGRTFFTDPISGQTFRYSFNGVSTAINPAANNVNTETYLGTTVEWDQSAFRFMNNPSYAHTYKDPVLGLIADGQFVIGREAPYNTIQNWAMYTPTSSYLVDQDGTPRGNMAKYGSVIGRDTPWDGTYYGWGWWSGYGRQLPHIYDTHMLNTPSPYFVRIPGAGNPGPTVVTVTIGATYLGTN